MTLPFPHLHVHVGKSQKPGVYRLTMMNVLRMPEELRIEFVSYGTLEEFESFAHHINLSIAEQRRLDAKMPA